MFAIALRTLLNGSFVGEDEIGNRYYQSRRFLTHQKRWVVYKNASDPTTVPSKWYGWLHKTSDETLEGPLPSWGKPHAPNGTFISPHRPHSTLPHPDYTPWTPK